MMRSRWLILVWILGILFPMAWLGKYSAGFRRAFDAIFAPTWMHILMHALLYTVLVVLLLVMFRWQASWKTAARALSIVLVVGCAQEGLQSLGAGIFYASAALFDLGVDLAGGIGGILIGVWLARIHLHPRVMLP
ncbi:MAG: hypothetical protein EHM70_06945 [Chloroflexota bacterium]|nr:MAG: hypothetical protein EHM70_06945 [Chloroflexota bacterium]